MKYLIILITLAKYNLEGLCMLNISRQVLLDTYIGLPCQRQSNSHDTGSGECKCNFEFNTFFSRNNSLPSCIHNKNVPSVTGCPSGINIINATKKENITLPCNTRTIEVIEIWDYNVTTKNGDWVKKWNKTIHSLFKIESNNLLHIKYGERKWEGLLIRISLKCNALSTTCLTIAFLGNRSHPLQNNTLQGDIIVDIKPSKKVTGGKTNIWMFIWLTCGLSLAIMVIVIVLVAVFISKRRSKKFTINDEERVKQRLPPNSSIETGVEITDDSNQIYKELDEKYQHCKSFYKPLELNQGSQRQEQPIYEEVEPEYREIEPTYNELEPRCDIYEEVPYSVNSKTDSVLSESVQSTDIHKKTSPETFKYMFAEVSKD